MKLSFFTTAVFVLLALRFSVPLAEAQENGLNILSNETIVDFPESVVFRLELNDYSNLVDATLTYQLGQHSCLAAGTQVPVEYDGSALEWTWVMSRSGNPPPGAVMWWQWTVTDTEGNTITTPKEQLTFTDDRFEWRTIESNGGGQSAPIRLHWYKGEDVGPILLDAAEAGLERLQEDAGIELQGEVEFYIYEDSADMRDALLYVQDWAGGIAFSDYNIILIGVPPHLAQSWGSATVRHELAHLVIGQYAQSCLGGSLPNWLSEGLAMYAEGEPDEQTLADLENGVQNNTFQPVRSLNGSFPTHGDQATAAYSQSYSLVDYLLDTHGQDKMQQLLLTLAAAVGYDQALESVYGVNADGLELAWRAAVSAPPRPIPPTPTRLTAASVPTIAPINAASSRPTLASDAAAATPPPAEAPAAEDPSSGLCAFGLAPILLAGLASAFVSGKRKSSAKSR